MDSRVAATIAQLQSSAAREHVEQLASIGPRSVDDPRAVARTLQYLSDQLQRYGYEVVEEPFGRHAQQINLLATRTGQERPHDVLELGAHYDTVRGSPGADDNASGVAGLLEVARVLAGVRLKRSVRFCLFGEEESGLAGSRQHAQQLNRAEQLEHERAAGILVFEMIGYRAPAEGSQRTPVRIPLLLSPPRRGDFIAVVANFASRQLATGFRRAGRRYVPDLRQFVVKMLGGFLRDAARSDHVSYWRCGRPGVMITDTANFRNPHYHQPTDLPETLDYEFLISVARATAATLLDWSRLVDERS